MSEKVTLYHGTPHLESILLNGSIDCRNKQDGFREEDCKKSYDEICSKLAGLVKEYYRRNDIDKQHATNELYAIQARSEINPLELFGFESLSEPTLEEVEEICSREEYKKFISHLFSFSKAISFNHVYLGKDMTTSREYVIPREKRIKYPIQAIFELNLPRNDVKEYFEYPLIWWGLPLTQENVIAVHIKNDFGRADEIIKKYLKDTKVKRF